MEKVGFGKFLVLWNQRQGMRTPKIHMRMAQWLEDRWEEGEIRMVLMAFRSAGKSTIVGVFCAWLLYRNPDLRILVLAADARLAGKMVRNVRRMIERHPLTANLKPERLDQWAADRFTVRRKSELRDPSMLAQGVTGNITGSRADVVICDDVEVPNTCDSAEKRESLRTVLGEMAYVLVAGGRQVYVGTPHHYYSIYADEPRKEIGEGQVFLDGFARLCIPVTDEAGNIAWPERYREEDIERIRRETGSNKFDSQMMLKAVNIMEGRLNPDLIEYYDAPVEYVKELKKLYIGQNQMEGVRAFWDPALGKASGDSSVLAVVFTDAGGNFYLQHVAYISVDEDSDISEAEQQCKAVAEIAKELYLTHVCIETNGIGNVLPKILRQQMMAARVPCVVIGQASKKAKEVRILEAFDALLAAGRLFVHEQVTHTPFIMEMREWRPKKRGQKDDGLDAVAGAILGQPDRSESCYAAGTQDWTRTARPQKAKKTDFEV